MAEINDLLEERGSNYGNFHTFSNLSQSLYTIILTHYNEVRRQQGDTAQLPAFMAESLRMICHKLARIANGNPYHVDSWVDIGGYSQLAAKIIEEAIKQQAEEAAKQQIEAAKVKAKTEVEQAGQVKEAEQDKQLKIARPTVITENNALPQTEE